MDEYGCKRIIRGGALAALWTITLWILMLLFGGVALWILFIQDLVKGCNFKNLKNLATQSTTTLATVHDDTNNNNDEEKSSTLQCDIVKFWVLFILISVGSLAFLGHFIYSWPKCVRENRKFLGFGGKNRTIKLQAMSIQDEKFLIRRIDNVQCLLELSPEKNSDAQKLQYVNELVKQTWKYQERLGRDSYDLTHNELVVKKVFKINNEKHWDIYQKERSKSLSDNVYPDEIITNPVFTTVSGRCSSLNSNSEQSLSELDQQNHLDKLDTNEVYLFHGTKLEHVPGIAEKGFDLSKARRGLYGKAIYLAESSEKADQYADYPKRRRQTNLTMLLTRVTLGRVHCHREEKAVHVPKRGFPGARKLKYDTVIAGVNKRFREFLVFDSKHCYPEYLIIYDRK